MRTFEFIKILLIFTSQVLERNNGATIPIVLNVQNQRRQRQLHPPQQQPQPQRPRQDHSIPIIGQSHENDQSNRIIQKIATIRITIIHQELTPSAPTTIIQAGKRRRDDQIIIPAIQTRNRTIQGTIPIDQMSTIIIRVIRRRAQQPLRQRDHVSIINITNIMASIIIRRKRNQTLVIRAMMQSQLFAESFLYSKIE